MDYSTTASAPCPLAAFQSKAILDFITLRAPNSLMTESAARTFKRAIKGRIQTPKKKHAGWVTIHDPQRADLQYLLDNYPEVEILALEVAVDLFLKDGTNNAARLGAAHRYLAVNLFPQAHQKLAKGTKRKIYTDDGKIRVDTMKTGSGGMSVYWANAKGFEQIRLYIKTLDNKLPLARHSTRLEITLNRGGCQDAGINRVCLLPGFAKTVRRYLSPFFKVAAGIKPRIRRTRTTNTEKAKKAAYEADKSYQSVKRAYEKFGAASAAKNGKKIAPDRLASATIGGALKGLREQLIGLKLPENSAALLERWGENSPIYKGFSEYHEPLSIEATST